VDGVVDGVVDGPESWPVHEVERIWDGAAPFSVRRDLISAPGRPDERFGRLVLEHPGAVVILAVDERDRALVLRPYRDPASLRFVELPREVHPFYVGTQAHPELRSRPTRPHPLFAGLVGAALQRQREQRLEIDETTLRRPRVADLAEAVEAGERETETEAAPSR
jgi:hypothetical protein